MKIAVLGAAGQLGRDLCPRLRGEVRALTRADAELTRPETLHRALDQFRPDILVNCAAYNLVDKAEADNEIAFAVNAWGARELALACRKVDITLVHFSTDYVFGLDGERKTPYTETDAPGPVSVYGLSKLVGEYFVRSVCPRHFVIRTCGLYGVWGSGGKGGNFVETMLRVARQGKPLRVVCDQICTPSYTVDIATAAAALIETQGFGLYHLTNSGSCSWHEFAAAIFDMAGMKADLTPITTGEYGAVAGRPAYSVLELGKYESANLGAMRTWQQGLAAYLKEREQKEPPVLH